MDQPAASTGSHMSLGAAFQKRFAETLWEFGGVLRRDSAAALEAWKSLTPSTNPAALRLPSSKIQILLRGDGPTNGKTQSNLILLPRPSSCHLRFGRRTGSLRYVLETFRASGERTMEAGNPACELPQSHNEDRCLRPPVLA